MKLKASEYLRDLSSETKKELKKDYKSHANKVKFRGFLTTEDKHRLLGFKKWQRGTSDDRVYGFFSDIRMRAENAFIDFELLNKILNEEQLQEIFGKKQNDLEPMFSKILTSLLPSSVGSPDKEIAEQILKTQQWRKEILYAVLIKGLAWYYNSGIFKSSLERRMLKDIVDSISVASTGGNYIIQDVIESMQASNDI